MFLVIEGLDGAGKSTQVKLLRNYLKEKGIETEYIHFPRFDAPFYGELVARYLRGDFGGLDDVDPYIVAVLYAGDRSDASKNIERWLDEGKYVIVDRYVYSNIAYQCAKIEDSMQREKLRRWIFDLEYGNNKIIRPTLSIFLDVPFKFTTQSLTSEREGDDRLYLEGKSDIHEASLTFQEKVRKCYLDQATLDNTFKIVDCSDAQGNMLPSKDIFDRIVKFI
ncbi:MAG: dTMP kinase [Rikenellaceae bacterium]